MKTFVYTINVQTLETHDLQSMMPLSLNWIWYRWQRTEIHQHEKYGGKMIKLKRISRRVHLDN